MEIQSEIIVNAEIKGKEKQVQQEEAKSKRDEK